MPAAPSRDGPRVNEEIRVPQVRLIDQDGEMLGVMSARDAIQRSFAMPLKAAGFADAKVVARFAGEPEPETSYLDRSTSYNEAIEEARRRRAGQGQR